MDDCGLCRGSRCGGRSLLSAALLGGRLGVNHLLPLLRHPPRALACWCLGGALALWFHLCDMYIC
jgi:hypothetical protein